MGKGNERNVLDEDMAQENLFQDSEKENFESTLDEINGISENSGVTVTGRIYRIVGPSDAVGRPATELVGKVDCFVDEDYVGRHYGSGRYKIRFRIKKNGESGSAERNVSFSVGREYDRFVKPETKAPQLLARAASAQESAPVGFFDKILENVTSEKIAMLSMAIEAVKKIFAPPPQPDWIRLIEVLSKREPQKPAFSDTVVMSAMESLKEKNKTPSVFDQVREYNKLKDLFRNEEAEEKDEKDNGEMNLLLKTAFEYLPILLKKNNGNYQEVGRQAAEMPMIKNMVQNDPELAQNFFQCAKDRFGFAAARDLARGFGIDMQFIPDNPTPPTVGATVDFPIDGDEDLDDSEGGENDG